MAPARVPKSPPGDTRRGPAVRPPSAKPVFFAQGSFDAERIARLFWMLTGKDTSPEELEDIRRVLEEEDPIDEEEER